MYADYIAPWTATGSYGEFYHRLLAEHLLFYTSILRAFLDRAGKYDPNAIVASLRSAATQPQPQSEKRSIPDIIVAVLGCLRNPPEVLDALRLLEHQLMSSSDAQNPAQQEARYLISQAWTMVPASIRQFESNYAVLFAPGAQVEVANRCAGVLVGALRVLQQSKNGRAEGTAVGMAAAATPTANPANEESANRVRQALDSLQAVFGLALPDDALQPLELAGPAENRRIFAGAPKTDEKAVASKASKFLPFIAVPEQLANGQLTQRGKYMVRHGLEKSNNLDVPVIEAALQDPALKRKREQMVADHENVFLVMLTAWIAQLLRWITVRALLWLAERYPDLQLPVMSFDLKKRPHVSLSWVPILNCAAMVSFKWLRWFASYPNIVLVVGCWLIMRVLWIVWKLVVFLVMPQPGVARMPAPPASGGGGRSGPYGQGYQHGRRS